MLLIVSLYLIFINLFFFSSRRRHTSWPRDWSSDVCSSDLVRAGHLEVASPHGGGTVLMAVIPLDPRPGRSEERRVGKKGIFRSGANFFRDGFIPSSLEYRLRLLLGIWYVIAS